jgi:hypothetical protein
VPVPTWADARRRWSRPEFSADHLVEVDAVVPGDQLGCRYFRHRCDDALQRVLRVLGDVVDFETWDWDFETWDWFEDRGHYQFARVVTRQHLSSTPAGSHV